MSEFERRYTAGKVELRARNEKRTIGGYAAKFEKPSQNLGGFIEVIQRSFFNKSKGDGWPDTLARYNHDDNMLLGTTGSGTLRLNVDEVGLDYEVDLPQARADVLELVERGDVHKSSFAFRVYEDDWTMSDQGFPQRSLLSGQLIDVAPVNSPAYLDTSTGLRSLADKFEADIEEVRSLAGKDELRKFFKVTTGPQAPQKRSAAARLAMAKAIKL
jgi:HK97 family phage prohead protease